MPEKGRRFSKAQLRDMERREQRAAFQATPKEKISHTTELDRNKEIIQAEIERRGFKPSESERKLLEPFNNPPFMHLPPRVDIFLQGNLVLKQYMPILEHTENTVIQDAHKDAKAAISSSELSVYLSNERPDMPLSIQPFGILSNGAYHWRMEVHAETLLTKMNGFIFVQGFAHEVEHYRRNKAFDLSLDPNLTPQERMEMHRIRGEDYETTLLEEAYAEAISAEALIQQIGLGYEGYLNPGGVRLMANYIENGCNPESPGFLKVLREEFRPEEQFKPYG